MTTSPRAEPDDLDPPTRRTIGDAGVAVTRAALGAVPLVGAPLQELLATIVKAPIDKRRDEWMVAVASRLLELENAARISIEGLQENEAFISVVMKATDAAVRTSDETKLEALRNAVANAACEGSPEESLEVQYISLVDQLTGWHLRILKYLSDPKAMLAPGSSVLTTPQRDIKAGMTELVPELASRPEVIEQLYEDLFVRRLVDPRSTKVGPRLPAIAKRTTAYGDSFLTFVTAPPSSDQPSREAE